MALSACPWRMCSTQSSPIGPAFCLHPFANVSSEFTGSSRKLLSYRVSFLGYQPKASFTTAGSAAAANRAGQRAQGKKRQCGQAAFLQWRNLPESAEHGSRRYSTVQGSGMGSRPEGTGKDRLLFDRLRPDQICCPRRWRQRPAAGRPAQCAGLPPCLAVTPTRFACRCRWTHFSLTAHR